MQKIRCTACSARLKLPNGFAGDTVKCPKCGTPFSTRETIVAESQPEAPTPSATATASPEPAGPINPVVPRIADAQKVARSLRSNSVPAGAPLDFQFKHYWTPAIVRFAWFGLLILALLWIVFLSVAFAGSFFSGEDTSLLDTFGFSDLSISSLDLEGALSGRADVDSLNKFLDDVTESGSAGNRKTKAPRTLYQTVMAFGFSALSFVTMIASLVLGVLLCRVFFETIVVLFDISRTLRSIEQRGIRPESTTDDEHE